MRPSTDQLPTDPDRPDRVTVPEASAILGITSDAVRARLRRGTLHKERGEDGTVYVRLGAPDFAANGSASTDRPDRPNGRTTSRPTDPQPSTDRGQPDATPLLVEALRDQVEMLRGEVEAWREEARRKDTIIMALAQRGPELEAAPEPPGAPETASEPRSGTDTPAPENEPRRSWWRRWFSG